MLSISQLIRVFAIYMTLVQKAPTDAMEKTLNPGIRWCKLSSFAVYGKLLVILAIFVGVNFEKKFYAGKSM